MSFKGIDVRQSNTDWLVVRAMLLDSAGENVTTGQALLYLYELQSDGSLKSFDWYDKTFKSTLLTEEHAYLVHQKGNGGTRDTGIWTLGFQVRSQEESSSSTSTLSSSSSSNSVTTSSSSDTVSSSSRSSMSSSSTSQSISTSSSSSSSTSSQTESESSPASETEFTIGNIYIAMVYHASASPPWQAREFQWGEEQGDGLDAIADAVLTRDFTKVAASIAERCLLQAARFIRNKFSTTDVPGFVVVYEEDDVTEAYRKALTTDPAAEPIVEG